MSKNAENHHPFKKACYISLRISQPNEICSNLARHMKLNHFTGILKSKEETPIGGLEVGWFVRLWGCY